MPNSKQKKMNFEESLDNLHTIVENMESGDLSLEDSLAQFEKGIKLTRDCTKALKDAEQKVKILTENNGLENFAPLEDEDDA